MNFAGNALIQLVNVVQKNKGLCILAVITGTVGVFGLLELSNMRSKQEAAWMPLEALGSSGEENNEVVATDCRMSDSTENMTNMVELLEIDKIKIPMRTKKLKVSSHNVNIVTPYENEIMIKTKGFNFIIKVPKNRADFVKNFPGDTLMTIEKITADQKVPITSKKTIVSPNLNDVTEENCGIFISIDSVMPWIMTSVCGEIVSRVQAINVLLKEMYKDESVSIEIDDDLLMERKIIVRIGSAMYLMQGVDCSSDEDMMNLTINRISGYVTAQYMIFKGKNPMVENRKITWIVEEYGNRFDNTKRYNSSEVSIMVICGLQGLMDLYKVGLGYKLNSNGIIEVRNSLTGNLVACKIAGISKFVQGLSEDADALFIENVRCLIDLAMGLPCETVDRNLWNYLSYVRTWIKGLNHTNRPSHYEIIGKLCDHPFIANVMTEELIPTGRYE